jgi:hypothetical protein
MRFKQERLWLRLNDNVHFLSISSMASKCCAWNNTYLGSGSVLMLRPKLKRCTELQATDVLAYPPPK